jgi:translation initiation factor 2B subunit (eIF-2B alpha/beta/delta family)
MTNFTTIAIKPEKKEILDELKLKAKSYDELIDKIKELEEKLEKEIKRRKSLELLLKWKNNPISDEEAKRRKEEVKKLRRTILR